MYFGARSATCNRPNRRAPAKQLRSRAVDVDQWDATRAPCSDRPEARRSARGIAARLVDKTRQQLGLPRVHPTPQIVVIVAPAAEVQHAVRNQEPDLVGLAMPRLGCLGAGPIDRDDHVPAVQFARMIGRKRHHVGFGIDPHKPIMKLAQICIARQDDCDSPGAPSSLGVENRPNQGVNLGGGEIVRRNGLKNQVDLKRQIRLLPTLVDGHRFTR